MNAGYKTKKMVGYHWLWLWWVVVGGGVCAMCVQCVKDHTAQKETEKMALDHSANMSTEIKLVYYFQRGKKITKQKSSHILH